MNFAEKLLHVLTGGASSSSVDTQSSASSVAADSINSTSSASSINYPNSSSEANNVYKQLGADNPYYAEKYLDNLIAQENAASQREYETYMSNTAHQREMADLQAAGLNPILTATGGSGASTPAVTVASQNSASAAEQTFSQVSKLAELAIKSTHYALSDTAKIIESIIPG